MGLGGEVDHGIAPVHHGANLVHVLDRAHDELHVEPLEVLLASGVGELVENDDLVLLTSQPHVGGADEAAGPGDEQSHAVGAFCSAS